MGARRIEGCRGGGRSAGDRKLEGGSQANGGSVRDGRPESWARGEN